MARGEIPPEDVALRQQMVAEHLAAHPEDRARLEAAWAEGARQATRALPVPPPPRDDDG